MTSITFAESNEKIIERIGKTPLIELKSFSTKKTKIFAKLEWFNPFGSVKDRAAFWMIKDAEERKLITKGKSVIIEPTSGNTGIALTGIASSLGYKVEIVIPEKVSEETKSILRNLGATLHETSDDLCPRVGSGTDQSIALAYAISKPRPDVYYMPNQYENDANYLAHYNASGPEIWEQTENKITHFFTGCGTGGTITGIGKYLKEKNTNLKVIAIQAQKNHLLQGLRNFQESSKPDLFVRREDVVDEWYTATNQKSFQMVKELAERENILAGPSSGSVLASMVDHMEKQDKKSQSEDEVEKVYVGIFADDGRKFKSLYVQQGIFTEKEYDEYINKCRLLPKLAYQ